MEYRVRVWSAVQGNVVALANVAEAMAKRAATLHGTLPLHEPTLKNLRPERVRLLWEAAMSGQLTVCDSHGRVARATELIETASASVAEVAGAASSAYITAENNLPYQFARQQDLIEWGKTSGDVFLFVETPGTLVNSDLRNFTEAGFGEVIEAGYSIGAVGGGESEPWRDDLYDTVPCATKPEQSSPVMTTPHEAQRGHVLTLPSGQTHVQFGELAHLIVDALWPHVGPNDDRFEYGCARVNLDAELARAVKSGVLPVKDPLTFGPHTFPIGDALKKAVVTIDDLREFVAGRGLSVIIHTAPAQSPPAPKPVGAVGASGGVMPNKAKPLPLPLTTSDIAFCFAGLRWKTEEKWKKPLGDKPKWLAACIAIPGARGVSETRWNPVFIGAALVRGGYAKPNSVRAKFQTQPLLTLWLDEWKTYEADNYDSY